MVDLRVRGLRVKRMTHCRPLTNEYCEPLRMGYSVYPALFSYDHVNHHVFSVIQLDPIIFDTYISS